MNQPFQYSVLRYRPSYLLDERVNIGLLFHFADVVNRKHRFIFVFPSTLVRVSNFFPGSDTTNLTDIKRYLKAFQQKANELTNKNYTPGRKFDEMISSEFIVKDANSFFFSETKGGYYQSIDQTVEYFQAQYFKHYSKHSNKKSKDALVKEFFYQSLTKNTTPNDIRLTYFEEGVVIENKITTTKFEYRWQNGYPNLIKTLGFDVRDKHYIQNKAFKWSSAINYICKMDKYKDYHFDILVSRPSNKTLFGAYDKALNILTDIKGSIKIIEDEGIEIYAQKALEHARPLQLNNKA